MNLYHGTSAEKLERIMRDGIVPRAKLKTKGNWKHSVLSNRDAVYLTDAYAWHFAAATTDEELKGLILEVDSEKLLPWRLCPDEDWMEQVTRKSAPSDSAPHFAPTSWSMNKRTRHYRKIARYNSNLAYASLGQLGTAAYYDTIPWSAVTRYVVIDWDKLAVYTKVLAIDSMVSIPNYRFLQERHRAFTRWLFGDPATALEVSGYAGWDPVPEMMAEAVAACEKALAVRDGLTVVDLRQQKAA